MGADEEAPGHESSRSTATTLLPTHRLLITVAKHTLPFYSVPLHYLRRRGVFLVLLCMGGIAFLHSAYLFPSDNDLLRGSISSTDSEDRRVGFFDNVVRHLGRLLSIYELELS